MDRGAWWAIVHGVTKESDMTEQPTLSLSLHNTSHSASLLSYPGCLPELCAKLLQLCLSLCNPMDCSLPGSSVYGIPQARILEWVAMPSSSGSSQLRDQTHIS